MKFGFTLFTLGCMMTASALLGRDQPAHHSEPTGASLAWTSDEPVVARARQLVLAGQLRDAQAMLNESTDAQREMLEIIRRIRRDYSLDEATLLGKIRKSIPDVTAEDLLRWRDAKQVQYRTLDGQIIYFNREPSNIFRFCDEAKNRRDQHSTSSAKTRSQKPNFVLIDHLAQVITAAEKSGSIEVLPIRHRIIYALTIEPNRPGAKTGSIVRAWLPYPHEYRQQKGVKLISTSPAGASVAPDDAPQRTIYFEHTIDDPTQPIRFQAVFEYTSSAYYPILDPKKVKQLRGDWGDAYLVERLPHIALTPELKQKTAEIVGAETNPLEKVRKIYRWLDANIRYHAEEEYCIIRSFSQACLERGRGDCGIQTMLFITMCRCAGVPARWQSGWETKPVDWNMHDWAEVYLEPWGWLPCDPSYGLQKSDDPKVREFYIGHQDSYRMIVNTDYGSLLVPPKQSLRSEPADFQRGEVEIDGRNLYFDEWDYDFKFEQTAAEK